MLTDALIAAYRATDFVLFDTGDGEVVVNVGRRSAGFDRVLAARRAATAVIVTAYNPRSVVLPEAENRTRHAALTALLDRRGYDYALGEGRDPAGHWKAELECVVFGIPVEAGLDLARAFDQNAIVFVRRGEAPELVYPDLG
ncbi:MAG TPA: DUF3293 domain-containing protein [Bauldia sp.]|jgi:hypothetical protein|nr:DUF3293 domain-containing protein [Bauldia sp.]